MKIEMHRQRDINVIVPIGDLLLGGAEGTLRSAVTEGLDANVRRFVIDFGRLAYCDSSGIGELVAIHAAVTNQGGAVYLANVPRNVNEILQVTEASRLLEIFTTTDQAVDSFG